MAAEAGPRMHAQRDRARQTQRHRDTETQRQRHRDRDRQRQRQRSFRQSGFEGVHRHALRLTFSVSGQWMCDFCARVQRHRSDFARRQAVQTSCVDFARLCSTSASLHACSLRPAVHTSCVDITRASRKSLGDFARVLADKRFRDPAAERRVEEMLSAGF
eukprot:3385906-Rhodomonas_salina.1